MADTDVLLCDVMDALHDLLSGGLCTSEALLHLQKSAEDARVSGRRQDAYLCNIAYAVLQSDDGEHGVAESFLGVMVDDCGDDGYLAHAEVCKRLVPAVASAARRGRGLLQLMRKPRVRRKPSR